jgi:hypothetical protein
MTPDIQDSFVNEKGHTDTPTNGSSHAPPDGRSKGGEFARRATAFLSELPMNAQQQMRRSPAQALALAGALGLAAGVLLSSRIMRAALASAVSVVLVEVARSYVRVGGRAEGTQPIDPTKVV